MKKIDSSRIIGSRYGKWVVVSEVQGKRASTRYFSCRCDCGFEKEVSLSSLRGGISSCCQYCRGKKDYTGMRFARLTALRDTGKMWHTTCVWLFQCDCGNIQEFPAARIFGIAHDYFSCKECSSTMPPEEKRGHLTLKEAYRDATHVGRKNTRKLPFLLTIDEYDSITTSKPCYYCGKLEGRMGLDRVDNEKGYVYANIVPCCSVCNYLKHDIPVYICQKVSEFINSSHIFDISKTEGDSE